MTRAASARPPLAAAGLGGLAASLLFGLALVQQLAVLPAPLPLATVALVAALLAVSLARRWGWRLPLLLLLGLALLLGGLAWGSWRASQRLAEALPVAWEGRLLRFEAELVELPQALLGAGGRPLWRLGLATRGPATDADGAQLPLPPRISLWLDGTVGEPRAGERWRFEARLRRVQALQNPGLPDAELWLLERGVRAQGSARSAERLSDAAATSLQSLRQHLRDRIAAQVDAPRHRAVLAGLLIGDQAALSSADWALLRDTGVVHLFSISGVHITVFAWLAGSLIAMLWRRWPACCERLPLPLAARWGGALAALAYALLAGWGVPAQRTVALLLLLALLQTSGRLWPWPLALLVCALPIALADPWALVQPGFWLSFVAVALLMQQGRLPESGGGSRALRELLRTQAICTLGLAPLTLLFFGQVSLVGALANLIAVPLLTLLLTPLTLTGALLPPLWSLVALGVDLLFALLQTLAAWPLAVLHLPQAPLPLRGLALLGLPLVVLRLPRLLRGVGLLLVAPIFLWSPAQPAPGSFQLRVFDVGQGSAIWVRTAGHDLLYDAGPRWGLAGAQDAGARVLLPSLRAAGLRRLDLLLISHGDADHAGGATSLLAAFPRAARWAPPDPRLAGLQAQPCAAGQRWTWDGVHFELLHPAPRAAARKANAASCVLRVVAANGAAALLPGDIGSAEERELIDSGAELRSDLLLLPHHGSAGSNSLALLMAVQPKLAFAQAGYRNRHGHPALAVQNRLRELGIPLLDSAGCGAFDWHSDAVPAAAGCWRQRRARYWHDAGRPEPDDEALHGPPELQ